MKPSSTEEIRLDLLASTTILYSNRLKMSTVSIGCYMKCHRSVRTKCTIDTIIESDVLLVTKTSWTNLAQPSELTDVDAIAATV